MVTHALPGEAAAETGSADPVRSAAVSRWARSTGNRMPMSEDCDDNDIQAAQHTSCRFHGTTNPQLPMTRDA
jgi:hypothetical protein